MIISVLALQKKRRANKGKNKKPPMTAKDEKRKERYVHNIYTMIFQSPYQIISYHKI